MNTMTQAVSSQGDQLLVLVNTEWKQIHELKSVPEIGDSPNKIDATSLESEVKEYINGLADQQDMDFVFNAMPVGSENSNVDLLMSLSRTTIYDFCWKSPRLGIQMVWKAEFTYKYGAGEVDSVRELTVSLIPHSKPVESAITATYSLTYNTNGGSGTAPTSKSGIKNGEIVTVSAKGSMTGPSGKTTFGGWNTASDGSGYGYDEGDAIVMYRDVTLYAIWSA